MASGKYKFKMVKGSLVVDLHGNILDFQVHDYGLRNDTAMWPFHRATAQAHACACTCMCVHDACVRACMCACACV